MQESLSRDPAADYWNCVDLAAVVAHEFNNVLNNIQLHLAVMELKGANGAFQAELSGIRQISASAAVLIREFQQFGRKQHPPLRPVDLNAAIRAAVADWPAVQLHLSADLPLVQGTESDLKRLVRLLLAYGEAGVVPGATITTEPSGPQVVLRVVDTGPQVPDELLPQLFEPFAAVRPGIDPWTLAVCKALVRRLQGTIEGTNRPEGGMAFTVCLRTAL
jgi:two-component system, NtrC family, C4-dicarboxylate transport sensor histidine kinase DctB